MTTLTFTQTENGSEVATPDCSVVFGTEWSDKILNQFELDTVDGGTVVYSAGPNKCTGLILLKNLSYADGLELYEWIRDDIDCAKSRFTIAAVANLNLGKGKNTAITNARWAGGPDLKGYFEFVPPGFYNVKFPYTFVR